MDSRGCSSLSVAITPPPKSEALSRKMNRCWPSNRNI
jgi:hypothetical protein